MLVEIMPARLLSTKATRKRRRPNDEGLGCFGLNELIGYEYRAVHYRLTSGHCYTTYLSVRILQNHHDHVSAQTASRIQLLYSVVLLVHMYMDARALVARCRWPPCRKYSLRSDTHDTLFSDSRRAVGVHVFL